MCGIVGILGREPVAPHLSQPYFEEAAKPPSFQHMRSTPFRSFDARRRGPGYDRFGLEHFADHSGGRLEVDECRRPIC